MGLNVYLKRERQISYDKGKTFITDHESVYGGGTTHNLCNMADEAGIYEALWRPHMLHPTFNNTNYYENEDDFEVNTTMYAQDIIDLLERGLANLKIRSEYYKQFDSPNGWGTYNHFVLFVEEYLQACKTYPDAIIETCR